MYSHRLVLEDLHLDLSPGGLLDEPLDELGVGIGHPGRPLGVVGLLGVLPLVLLAEEEEGRGVRVGLAALQDDAGAGHLDGLAVVVPVLRSWIGLV